MANVRAFAAAALDLGSARLLTRLARFVAGEAVPALCGLPYRYVRV